MRKRGRRWRTLPPSVVWTSVYFLASSTKRSKVIRKAGTHSRRTETASPEVCPRGSCDFTTVEPQTTVALCP